MDPFLSNSFQRDIDSADKCRPPTSTPRRSDTAKALFPPTTDDVTSLTRSNLDYQLNPKELTPREPLMGFHVDDDAGSRKARGPYMCRDCGQPKKGHRCNVQVAGPPVLPPGSNTTHKRSRPGGFPSDQGLHGFEPKRVGGTGISQQQRPLDSWQVACESAEVSRKLLGPSAVALSQQTSSLHQTSPPVASGFVRPRKLLVKRPRQLDSPTECHVSMPRQQGASILQQTEAPHWPTDGQLSAQDSCLMGILSKLAPMDLLSSSMCCKRWNEVAARVWGDIQEATLLTTRQNSVRDYVPFVLRKCPKLVHLSVHISTGDRLTDAALLSLAQAQPRLLSLKIRVINSAASDITSLGLESLLASCPHLEHIDIDGCASLASITIRSQTLRRLSLASCHCLVGGEIRCPELRELSLDMTAGRPEESSFPFVSSEPEDSSSDSGLADLMDQISGCSATLERLHVASRKFTSNDSRHLFKARFPHLKFLSISLAKNLKKESFLDMFSKCPSLGRVNFSGCLQFCDHSLLQLSRTHRNSLTHIFLAACPRLTPGGLQIATEWLPYLELLDLGYSLVHLPGSFLLSDRPGIHGCHDRRNIIGSLPKLPNRRKADVGVVVDGEEGAPEASGILGEEEDWILRLRSPHLRKLSLWGCTKLMGLDLDCPELVDLNVNECGHLEASLKMVSKSRRICVGLNI